MEILEEQIVALALLLLQKAKIEKKLRQTFKCFLRKLFSCCGMKNIEHELQFLNDSISQIKQRDALTQSMTQSMKVSMV